MSASFVNANTVNPTNAWVLGVSYVTIAATNVINRGTLGISGAGLLKVDGSNVDLPAACSPASATRTMRGAVLAFSSSSRPRVSLIAASTTDIGPRMARISALSAGRIISSHPIFTLPLRKMFFLASGHFPGHHHLKQHLRLLYAGTLSDQRLYLLFQNYPQRHQSFDRGDAVPQPARHQRYHRGSFLYR